MPENKAAFDWALVMTFGLGILKLSPSAFWLATPREIAAAMRAYSLESSQPPIRADLEFMMQQFPDLAA